MVIRLLIVTQQGFPDETLFIGINFSPLLELKEIKKA